MRIINFFADLLFRHQKKLEIIAVFILCLAVSFRFTNFKTVWLWSDNTYIAVLLVLILIVTALVWIKIEKIKTNDLITFIKNEKTVNSLNPENKLDELSLRQKKVFDLIVIGKSNKEIMDELCIELSTLKTHINKIYKILEIKNRKEVQQLEKRLFNKE